MDCCFTAPIHYITLTSVDWSAVIDSDISFKTISKEMPQPSITNICLNITYLKFHSHFPGSNEFENTKPSKINAEITFVRFLWNLQRVNVPYLQMDCIDLTFAKWECTKVIYSPNDDHRKIYLITLQCAFLHVSSSDRDAAAKAVKVQIHALTENTVPRGVYWTSHQAKYECRLRLLALAHKVSILLRANEQIRLS